LGSNGWEILFLVRDTTLTFLISTEAAELLRISKRTLERMRVDGTGPRYLKAGPGKRSRVLYRESDILAWLERRSFGSTSEYTAR
jgi:predicted DNA-binding transcriptional regulator AlpA